MPRNLSAWADMCIYLVILAIFIVILLVYNFYIGAIGFVVWLTMIFFARERCRDRRKKFEEYCRSVISNVNILSNYAIESLPQAILIIDSEGRLQWANKSLARYWGIEPEVGMNIREYWPEALFESIWGSEGEYVFADGERFFRAEYHPIETAEIGDIAKETEKKPQEAALMVFFVTDVSDFEHLRQDYINSRTVMAYIQIDNYDEVLQGLAEAERTALLFEVNRLLGEWIVSLGGFLRRVSSDLYVVIMERHSLDQAVADKFDILDKVRIMRSGNKLPVTLSVGAATMADAHSVNEMAMQAQANLDLALGRGGDQVAVLLDGKTQFYGGKATAVEKHTRVKARVVAHALRELIEASDAVYIMGHHNEDFDAFGAAMGVAKMARHFSKPVSIVLSDFNEGIDKFTDMLANKDEYSRLLVRAGDVGTIAAHHPLLIVVDTHIPHLVACPSLLQRIRQVVVIDHHRRSESCIQNPLLLYIEPSSSSASELVTELLMYYSENMTLSRIDATALYAGILVDTKNFAVQTGVRTFDAAAYLRRTGADPVLVRNLFRTDYETNLAVAKAKAGSTLYEGGLIAATCRERIPNVQVIAAQVADSLLRIENVNMSIVVFQLSENTVGVSARSAGEFNVQVIMEQFGGGGHQNVAGVQIKDTPLDEVYKQVVEAAQKYIKESD